MENIYNQIVTGDLYALFSICTKEDLDPIIQILTKKWNNFLEINENYKKYHPDHTKYYKEIVDELRSYGGNSFVNVIKNAPSYDELVKAVCSKLGIPFVKNNICESEQILIDLYSKDLINNSNTNNWQKNAIHMADKAAQNLSTLKEVSKGGAFTALGSLLGGPAAVGVISWKLAGAAYKVIVPCVVYIAFLRQQKLLEWKRNTVVINGQLPSVNKEFSIVDQDTNSEVLALFSVDNIADEGWNTSSNNNDDISKLNSLVQLIPSAATKINEATTDCFQVVIPKGMQLMKKKVGDAFCANLALVTDPKKVVKHADILSPSNLRKLVNMNVIFSVASTLVAQKHLADISKKLDDIKKIVENINRFQNNERRTQIIGAIRYCEQIAVSALNGDIEEDDLFQIEAIERQIISIQEHLFLDLQQEQINVCSFIDKERFGSKEITDEIYQRQQRIKILYEELMLCIRTRACAWQILCQFPGREIRKEARLNDIKKTIEKLSEEGDFVKKTIQALRDKIEDVKSLWNKNSTLNERKLTLIAENKNLYQFMISKKSEIENELESCIYDKEQSDMTFVLQVEDGKIKAYK